MSHLLTIAAAHGSESFQTELSELLANPAHWVFEWINDLVSWIFIAAAGRSYVKYRERRAIRNHDAKFHPDSHGVDSDAETVVK